MTCDHLRRLLVLSATVCAMRATSSVRVGRDFDKKVSIMLKEEPGTPKCFAEGRKDFTCFWEEEEEEEEENAGSVDQYSFTYNYQNENSSRCPLTVHRAHSGKKLIVCHLNQTQMFVQMDIEVHRETRLIHNRSLLVELVFLLDPPANVTVSTTGEQGQLNVSWVPPALKYMDDSLMYEVSYETVESHVTQVKVVQASSGVILRGLQPGTKYKARVRVKLDGISYNGYWSMWSDPVFMQTPHAGLDTYYHIQHEDAGGHCDTLKTTQHAHRVTYARHVLHLTAGVIHCSTCVQSQFFDKEDMANYSNSRWQVSRPIYRLWWRLSGVAKADKRGPVVDPSVVLHRGLSHISGGPLRAKPEPPTANSTPATQKVQGFSSPMQRGGYAEGSGWGSDREMENCATQPLGDGLLDGAATVLPVFFTGVSGCLCHPHWEHPQPRP
uniref:erythropoietin receptor isoform X3 n=1 Tax=Doryrhamphus excisus TaxID=161450 RepID=UPI0025ADA99A|nr:erythropoietin receptor isoform X3 [Doryrhamphus excisus]